MRTTITISDEMLAKAKKYSGLDKTSEVLDFALQAYVQREASSRLAALGGSDPFAEVAPRNRSEGHKYDFTPRTSIVADTSVEFNKKD